MGWQETVVDRHKEHVGGPIEYQDVETMRHQIKDEIDRVKRRLNAAKTGVPSEGCAREDHQFAA